MLKTVFEISKMDCPSEETLLRLKLAEISVIENLEFDIPARTLTVIHTNHLESIEQAIAELDLGSTRQSSEEVGRFEYKKEHVQKRLLWTVLFINFAFFVIEMSTGLVSKSMGLVADSLDMLADSFVYGISLIAVGGTLSRQKAIAKIAGYFQITLAVVGFIEVIRRFFFIERTPNFTTMIIVSVLALIANGICLYLLQKSKSTEAHMQASMIFTSNDVIINVGVIVAGLLVSYFNSNKPDLIVGSIVFLLVIQGAFRILRLGK